LDNLTHSLTGALLGQMGLKRLSGRAMATLVIAANIPDIDAVSTILGRESLAIRRGITHGPIATLLLPILLTGLVLAWDRWRPLKQGPPVRPGMLLLLAYIGTLSHPALDWLNSYGIRLLEPFSSEWFAGDTLFIIDVWIWAALIAGFWISRRREKAGGNSRRPAWIGFSAISAYIFANGLITSRAESLGYEALHKAAGVAPELVVANPQPVTFWKRAVLWRGSGLGGRLDYDAFRDPDGILFEGDPILLKMDHPALAASRTRADVRAYLFWSRMPIVIERNGRSYLADQRFQSSLTRDQFLVPLDQPEGGR
jgi:inner membrane protein